MDSRDIVWEEFRQELRIWKGWWWYSWGVIFGVWILGILLGNA